MKTPPTERELLALNIRLTQAKLQLNTAQLQRVHERSAVTPTALLTAAGNSRHAWQWLAFLPLNRYLKLGLTILWAASQRRHKAP
ncbi:MAG: hypothetical protein Q4G42_04865 [Neisseria sp.]|nr:hypothetical protein [Neisseria sp.]